MVVGVFIGPRVGIRWIELVLLLEPNGTLYEVKRTVKTPSLKETTFDRVLVRKAYS